MDPIYVIVKTEYSSDAKKAPSAHAAKAKEVMEKTVKAKLARASGFTTNPNDKKRATYTIIMKLNEIITSPAQVTVIIGGELNNEKGEMVGLKMSGKAASQGDTSQGGVMAALEGAVESLMDKTIPAIKRHEEAQRS